MGEKPRDWNFRTPLIYAAYKKTPRSAECVKVLLKYCTEEHLQQKCPFGLTAAENCPEGSAKREMIEAATRKGMWQASENDKKAKLEELLGCQGVVHLISTPFNVTAGFNMAEKVKSEHHNPFRGEYCYNPNTDSPQDEGGGWLMGWQKVLDKTAATGGTVFIVHNSRANGKYGEGELKGWFDGQAQQGEHKMATDKGCKIVMCPY